MKEWKQVWRQISKQSLALLLACSIILTLVPVAQAASDPNPREFRALTVNQSAQAGTSVSVAVYLEPGNIVMENDAYYWYIFKILYDHEALTLQEPNGVVDELGSSVFDVMSVVKGVIFVEATGFETLFVEDARAVLTLNFQVSPDMLTADSPVIIELAGFKLDTDIVMITDIQNGSVQVTNDGPTVSDVTVSGQAKVGQSLTGSYAYHDTEGNSEGNSQHRWYVSEQADGSDATLVEGAATDQLTLTEEMQGQYVIYGVKPLATTGTVQGTESKSSPVGPVLAGQVPTPGAGTIVIGQVEGRAGETVHVPVRLSAASTDIGAFGMQIDYDPAVLEVVGVTQEIGEMFGSHYDNETGWLRVGWADANADDPAVGAGQTLFTIDMLIKSDAVAGDYDLTVDTAELSHFSLADTEANEMEKILEAGVVSVSESISSGSYPWYIPMASTKERITLPIGDSPNALGQQLSTIVIERSLLADGSKQDKLTIGLTQAKEIVAKLGAAGATWAYLLIPDTEDAVSLTSLTILAEAAQLLADADIGLSLTINDVKLQIPGSSLADATEELYFRIVPVKDEQAQQMFAQRMTQSQPTQMGAYTEEARQLGRPVTIETNMQQRTVLLTLPVHTQSWGDVARQYVQAYAEHSDDTIAWSQGQWVSYTASGELGFEFAVDHFSTFMLAQLPLPTPYMSGYEDGSFRPDAPVTRAETALMLARLVNEESEGTQSSSHIPYVDVAADHWARAAITATASKWFNGYPDGRFIPNQAITRAEFAVVASALLTDSDIDSVQGQPFTDVASDHWAQAAIARLHQAGILTGYPDGSFAPNQPVTRAEAVTILNRVSGRMPITASDVSMWPDVSSQHWAFADIAAATLAE